jgi:uncharacterized membrane protein YgcG
MSDPEPSVPPVLRAADLLLLLAGGLAVYVAASSIGPGLNGAEFLVAFVIVWAVLSILHVALLRGWRDSLAVSTVAAAVLAAVALERYRWGVQQGMQRWGFLTILTVLGCASFFLRASQLRERSDGDSSWWSSGSGGSCASGGGGCGGGCGGGGCGGCGGG